MSLQPALVAPSGGIREAKALLHNFNIEPGAFALPFTAYATDPVGNRKTIRREWRSSGLATQWQTEPRDRSRLHFHDARRTRYPLGAGYERRLLPGFGRRGRAGFAFRQQA